jgi:ketosteroid isomerase-like protein
MANDHELDAAIERYHAAASELVNGNPEPQKAAFSHSDDVTLVNPVGFVGRGWAKTEELIERASSMVADGQVVGFERLAQLVTPEMAYIVEIERFRGKVDGSDEISILDLRVTSVFRPEDGTWKVVHRHADTITTPRPLT